MGSRTTGSITQSERAKNPRGERWKEGLRRTPRAGLTASRGSFNDEGEKQGSHGQLMGDLK